MKKAIYVGLGSLKQYLIMSIRAAKNTKNSSTFRTHSFRKYFPKIFSESNLIRQTLTPARSKAVVKVQQQGKYDKDQDKWERYEAEAFLQET